METTVLAHLAASMIQQKENLATEALAFILNRSPAARAALQWSLGTVVGDVPAIARVMTQLAVGEESRPDILLFAENGEQHFGYIEVKFWAAFTDAQPVEYVKRLQNSGGGVLIMLAPERRLGTMRLELIERLKAADLLSRCDELPIMADSVRLGLLSWNKLLHSLSDAVSEDRPAKSDVDQLDGLVKRVDDEGFMPLMRAELDDLDVPRRVISLADLANSIMQKAVADGVMSSKTKIGRYGPGHGWYRAGMYAKFRNAGCFLGMDHELWSMFGRTPIWVSFSGTEGRPERLHEVLRAWLNADPPRAYSKDGKILIPVLLAVGVEKDRVVADAVRQLRELNEELAISGLPPVHDEAPPET
jgi:hypothetical protein